MILRILGEGQFELPDAELDALNELDAALVRAIEAADEEAFRQNLDMLLARVHERGVPVPPEHLGASDLLLPGADATLDEVGALLSGEGLIPG